MENSDLERRVGVPSVLILVVARRNGHDAMPSCLHSHNSFGKSNSAPHIRDSGVIAMLAPCERAGEDSGESGWGLYSKGRGEAAENVSEAARFAPGGDFSCNEDEVHPAVAPPAIARAHRDGGPPLLHQSRLLLPERHCDHAARGRHWPRRTQSRESMHGLLAPRRGGLRPRRPRHAHRGGCHRHQHRHRHLRNSKLHYHGRIAPLGPETKLVLRGILVQR